MGNSKAIGMRIGPKGTVHEMAEALSTLSGGGNADAALWQVNSVIEGLEDPVVVNDAKYYGLVLGLMKKHGNEYIRKERSRLMRLVESENVSPEKRNSKASPQRAQSIRRGAAG